MRKIIEEIISAISRSVKFDSSQRPAEDGAPFGKGAAECLAHFLKIAQDAGFAVKNYDNYAGEVSWGDGEDFAVLAHLDVVPAGSGWTHAPFGGEVDYAARRIWGRGTMDDKGPAVIALYAMKALKDEGFKPAKRIKLIVGCNEENGWQCVDYYNAHAVMPETGFSPDANFPVIYAEKGILQVELKFPARGGFCGLAGGERANMVCDYCEVCAPADDEKLKKYGVESREGKIYARGKSAHGSQPQNGVNAISPILGYLGLDEMHRLLFEDGFGLGDMRDETGALTFSPDVIRQDGDGVYVVCDIRFPATYTKQAVLERIAAKGVPCRVAHYQAPLYNDKNCRLIRTLCEVYNEVTGKDVKPIAIGGGTYARALKCGAAFGPEEDGEEDTIHKPDEYITFDKIERCFEIYRLALKRLTEKEE